MVASTGERRDDGLEADCGGAMSQLQALSAIDSAMIRAHLGFESIVGGGRAFDVPGALAAEERTRRRRGCMASHGL